MEEEILQARVVLIFKKGNTSLYDNYRPISLLNTVYKIFASILQKRLAAGLDETLSNDGPFTVFAPTDDAFSVIR